MFGISCSGPSLAQLCDLREPFQLQPGHFFRNVVGQLGYSVTCPGMWLNGPHVSFDPIEQQRVMLLSRSPSGPKKYFPIPVEHLEEEIRIRSADDCKQFREEFNVSVGRGPLLGALWSRPVKSSVRVQEELSQRLRTLALVTTLSHEWAWEETWFVAQCPSPMHISSFIR